MPRTDEAFDVIVVGAGMAGLGCAGELVLRGARPLLISETPEVAWTLKPTIFGKNHCFLQHPAFQSSWGGGWWYHLARELNVPLRLHPGLPLTFAVRGTDTRVDLPICPTAAGIADLFVEMAPSMKAIAGEFEELVHAALAIPYRELFKMDRVPFVEWMADHAADGLATYLGTLMANLHGIPEDQGDQLSVFGGWGVFRGLMCGEVAMVVPDPDAQNGLAIPIARGIEQRGGTVWRGRKVASILTEGGKACGVVLADGQEVRAPHVAIAVGNPRIPALLDPLPPEIEEPLKYFFSLGKNVDFNLYTVLDEPVLDSSQHRLTGFLNPDFTPVQWTYPIHQFPWTTEPGKQLVISWANHRAEKVAELGGVDAVYADMHKGADELFPGYEKAMGDVATSSHHHHWSAPLMCGPKLPRKVDSVPGLWFVGDGSAPVAGMWTEAATGSGVLGARDILAAGK